MSEGLGNLLHSGQVAHMASALPVLALQAVREQLVVSWQEQVAPC